MWREREREGGGGKQLSRRQINDITSIRTDLKPDQFSSNPTRLFSRFIFFFLSVYLSLSLFLSRFFSLAYLTEFLFDVLSVAVIVIRDRFAKKPTRA